ncbi:MAG: hypothetical protein WC979_02640 [Candidatus Pacearchaeota archaeon]|jgi:hypothetical protein
MSKIKKPKEKFMYRIRLVGDTKFINPGCQPKASWATSKGAIDALKNFIREAGSYRPYSGKADPKKTISDYEVCIFPLNDPIVINAKTLADKIQEEEAEAKMTAQQLADKKRNAEINKQIEEKLQEIEKLKYLLTKN